MNKKLWNEYINKNICLLIMDTPYPRKREGICVEVDANHLWLQTEVREEPIPFLLSTIKRVDVQK